MKKGKAVDAAVWAKAFSNGGVVFQRHGCRGWMFGVLGEDFVSRKLTERMGFGNEWVLVIE